LVMIAKDFSSSLVLLKYPVSIFCHLQYSTNHFYSIYLHYSASPFLFRYLPSGHDCWAYLFQPRPTQVFSLRILPTSTILPTVTIPTIVKNVVNNQVYIAVHC
jgi:hypothetical protein